LPEKAVLGKISKISPAIGVRPVDKMPPKKKSAASDSDSDDSFIDDDSEDYGVSDDGSNGAKAPVRTYANWIPSNQPHCSFGFGCSRKNPSEPHSRVCVPGCVLLCVRASSGSMRVFVCPQEHQRFLCLRACLCAFARMWWMCVRINTCFYMPARSPMRHKFVHTRAHARV